MGVALALGPRLPAALLSLKRTLWRTERALRVPTGRPARLRYNLRRVIVREDVFAVRALDLALEHAHVP
jgi:hypothetical protein